MNIGLWMPKVVGASREILPGLVHCNSWMTLEKQKHISQICLNKILPHAVESTELRKRYYGRLSEYPDLQEICQEALSVASMEEPDYINAAPTHFICLQYLTQDRSQNYIPWHIDNGDNDGVGDLPITSISLGDSCDFLVKTEKSGQVTPIKLNSGDAVVFGKKSRRIWHSIRTIYKDSAPDFLPFRGSRINMTFRVTPHLIGREEEFKTVPKGLPANNKFYRIIPGKD